ncbi:hypothetical protein IV203_034077 [Nitzschia inconspicua]|uniref:Uncharacterized protein n=1 Tax=Nitzschia inconspicua TaxID=303405 RepID=A0A9K3M425_9STRA|nr:hypothetical protein IV203_034077 [Nitzschia inconspicua]
MDPELAKLMKLRRQKARGGASSSEDELELNISADETSVEAALTESKTKTSTTTSTTTTNHSKPQKHRSLAASRWSATSMSTTGSSSGGSEEVFTTTTTTTLSSALPPPPGGGSSPENDNNTTTTPRLITHRTRSGSSDRRRQCPSRENSGDDKSIMSERSHTSNRSGGSGPAAAGGAAGGGSHHHHRISSSVKVRSQSDYAISSNADPNANGPRRSRKSLSSRSSTELRPRRRKSSSLDLEQLEEHLQREQQKSNNSTTATTTGGHDNNDDDDNDDDVSSKQRLSRKGSIQRGTRRTASGTSRPSDEEVSEGIDTTDDDHSDVGSYSSSNGDEEKEEEDHRKAPPSHSTSDGSSQLRDINFDAAFGGTTDQISFETAPLAMGTTATAAELSDRNASAVAAFESDFGSFPTDFGSFPGAPAGSMDGGTDPFATAFGANNDYHLPSFGPTGSSTNDLAPLPPPPKVYDKSPIDNPPVNQAESASTKIKFISPRPILMMTSINPPPVANPLSGNLILCQKSNGNNNPNLDAAKMCSLSEWNPKAQTQLMSTPILTQELQRKIAQKYNVTAGHVEQVLSLSVGIHQAHGYERCRVGALLDLKVMENKEVLRVIAIWQWGYGGSDQKGGHPISLQSVLSPPSGSDFSYDIESLTIRDSCVFVAGASAKGPCVLLCKPTVRETWSANFVGRETARIAHMAATIGSRGPADPDSGAGKKDDYAERLPYLAIALTDGSISIWTYEAATKLTGKTNETVKRLLFPVCRLEGNKASKSWEVTPWNQKESVDANGVTEVGHCTHLEWIVPRGSSYSQLLLLAASFQGALCLYHVALPKIQDKNGKKYTDPKNPTEKTTLSQTMSIKPFCCSRWSSVYEKASASWIDLGPHMPPSLAILVTGLASNSDYARLAIATCPLAAYDGGSSKSSRDRLSFHIWDSHEWTKKLTHLPRSLVTSTFYNTRGILYVSETAIQEIEYRTNSRFPSMAGGVGSIPAGLTTTGTVHWSDINTAAGAGVLSVYTTYHCERRKSSSESSPAILEWSIPTRRHWLIQTFIGDSKESTSPAGDTPSLFKEEKEREEELVLGGPQPTVMCELSTRKQLRGLYPYRISRNPFSGGKASQHVAVWYRHLYGNSEAVVIGLVEKDEEDGKYNVVQVFEGRDLVFLPNHKPMAGENGAASTNNPDGIPQALVISRNGGAVALWQRKGIGGALKSPWQESVGLSCRPILGLEDESSAFIECRQFILCRFQEQISLLVVGTKSNGKSCVIAGPLVSEEGLSWSSLLPNVQEDPILWLNDREQVCLVVSLPNEGSIRGGFGVATTFRVLVLSPNLKVMAEQLNAPPPGSIVPLGSYTIAYCSHSEYKLQYLSGLPGSFGKSGIIASFPLPIRSYCPNWMLCIRPDRFMYNVHHNGTRLVERGQPTNSFLLPFATTRPALLLEPMIANAIATGGTDVAVQPFLRTVVEKFGRKLSTMTHGDDEGVGNFGAGITPRVLELLEHYNLKAAATWLLTGTIHFDRSANSRIMPSWMPISAKSKANSDTDVLLHVVSNGDQYLSEYIKSPDQNMAATLPRPSDPSSQFCKESAIDALRRGEYSDAIKMLDFVGTEKSDAVILQLSLAMQLDSSKDVRPVLQALFPQGSPIVAGSSATSVESLAALAMELKKNQTPSNDFVKRWMQPLAPSLQRWKPLRRHRTKLMGESIFSAIGAREQSRDALFSRELPESKLVWNEGPNREKDKLLMLDNIQDWFGRTRPVILGREGAKNAEDRGASTLADILNANDDDSFGGENEDDFKDGWADGVGEGLKDEDKLSAYFRFSEGEEEEASWREEGFEDISKFENSAFVYGCTDTAVLQESTSSVDEGESSKVKALYDLVFEQAGIGMAAALAIPASRGGSLDVGLMHGPDHHSRQKCTIEFWFWVPESISKEVILVRRTFGSSADDLESACKAMDKTSLLWELGLKKNGELEFRTIAGKSFKTQPTPNQDGDDDDTPRSTIHFGKWNHVCIILKQESIVTSTVSLLSRGVKVASSDSLSFSPPGFEVDDFSGASALDPMLEKSHLLYCLDHPKGFRITELRVWAMERNDDDIRTLMTEYLESAEIKKKFKVKIKKKTGITGGLSLEPPKPKSGLLAPPTGSGPTGQAKSPSSKSLLSPPGTLKPPGEGGRPPSARKVLAPPKSNLEPSPKEANEMSTFGEFDAGATPTSFGVDGFVGRSSASTFGSELQGENLPLGSPDSQGEMLDQGEPEISPLWDSAIPLSEQVRSSAAAALIRGPPATRHFGGNRGGLLDYRELERFGVGAISICGSEKTIVWRDDQVPPGLTYPIGASGAIVSDQMDEDGSEFLCCFLAKDKRMVVFELSTRTVVVELQMTTKLNYWRFLPPEAGEDTLCFMLVTPVGGFHWMPLDESPRPRQVWKRGPELQGKKIVCYEEGGSNGLDGVEMLSQVGMLLVTNGANGGRLEAWLVPICGDSQAICASEDILGACLCQPPGLGYEAFMPLLLFVVESDNDLVVCVSAVVEEGDSSVSLTEVMTDALIDLNPYQSMEYEPPTLAMGTYPEILCCSLGNTIVIIVRRKGLVVAYELAETGLELIAQENVGHYVIDAVMRYSAVEGGAEIVLLMSDDENPRDGRVGTFCFRSAG